MIKNILLMTIMALASYAAPVVGVQFGSASSTFGNLQVTVSGLGPSEVLTFREDWSVFVDYPDGYLPDGSQTYQQYQQTISNGTFNLGVYGRAAVMIGNGQFYSENLQYLHLNISSNLGNFVQNFYIVPEGGASYVALGPVRVVGASDVPEPGTLWGVGAGLVLLGLVGRKQRGKV